MPSLTHNADRIPVKPSSSRAPKAASPLPAQTTPSRRGAFRALGAGAAIIAAGALRPSAASAQIPRNLPADAGTLRLPATLNLTHLLRRTTYGVTPSLLAEVSGMGASQWLTQQLAPAGMPDPGGATVLAKFPKATYTTAQAKKIADQANNQLQASLQFAHIGRAIYSKRQLLEIMVDFWENHLNVYIAGSGNMKYMRVDYDLMIRRFALGKFSDLLTASAEHPAMLDFLNGYDNQLIRPNENYARELLELHTVGIHGSYTEDDVKAASKLLTGWRAVGHGDHEAVFDPKRHYVGPVSIMGLNIENRTATGGAAAMRELYAYLARRPSTARSICRKLAIRFVADSPSSELVDRLAAVYLKFDTAIVPVLKELFSSAEFAASAGRKTKRPLEFVASALRTMGAKYNDPRMAEGIQVLRLQIASHSPFGWVPPNGYPDTGRAWSSPGVSLEQFNTLGEILMGRIPGFGVLTKEQLVPASVNSVDGITSVLTNRWFNRAPNPQEITAARALVTQNGFPLVFTKDYQQASAAVAVGLMLLHSPAQLIR